MFLLFSLSGFIIFYAMLGYPITLEILDSFFKPNSVKKNNEYFPTVCLMIVAHNEEKCIKQKLENSIHIDYPKNKMEILVASDNSNDGTNEIVQNFMALHPEVNVRLYVTKKHLGKTNAQNEAQKTVRNEILVMTDANSMLDKNSIKEIVSSFSDKKIAYVCGKLAYTNIKDSTGDSESSYWNLDLKMRDIESRFQTITAGNGALYACRNKDYIDIDPIFCHDSMFPYLFALKKMRAVFNPEAVAYEKTGDNNADEFNRKVRMNRDILDWIRLSFKTFNYFKYKWFSLFFFGHRFCRYCLWICHLTAFVASFIAMLKGRKWGKLFTFTQLLFGIISAVSLKCKVENKVFRMIGYYSMTVFAQFVGVKNIVTGNSKPAWEKVESTRLPL